MSIVAKILRRTDQFVRRNIVMEQYPMLTCVSRKEQQRRDAVGVVFMLHHIEDKDPARIPTNEDLKVSPAFLEKIILKYKHRGFDFISLDDLYAILTSGKNPTNPFVAFTIDDGYLDNYTNALPVFEKHHVPFAVFVATDFIDNKAILWWDSVEALIMSNDEILTSDGQSYPCRTFQQRWDTFRYLRERILKLDQTQLVAELDNMFAGYHVDWYEPVRMKSMTWEQVKYLAGHPLCTIGGHTVSHPALSKLSADEAFSEIKEGKDRIEEMTGQTVRYFAYPYGTPNEVGQRESGLVEDLKFRLAFSAYGGCVTKASPATYLPRVYLLESNRK